MLFLSTSPLRGTTIKLFLQPPLYSKFLSTSPLRGTTFYGNFPAISIYISIHVPLAGDDVCNHAGDFIQTYFYPRPPCGGRRHPVRDFKPPVRIFLSTSPLRGTTFRRVGGRAGIDISIHVPLAGDDSMFRLLQRFLCISIHVPLAGDDSARCSAWQYKHISIHVPLAGDDIIDEAQEYGDDISIHVPLAGDDQAVRYSALAAVFLSTSPLRGTTVRVIVFSTPAEISIHVPLAGDDSCNYGPDGHRAGFLSTSPLRGTTSISSLYTISTSKFLSTSPLRGTTWPRRRRRCRKGISIHVPLAGDDEAHLLRRWRRFCISIHVPLAGDDPRMPTTPPANKNFYPRPPCGGRPNGHSTINIKSIFLSTSPLRGTTLMSGYFETVDKLLLSTSPLRGTTSSRLSNLRLQPISIHVPLAGDDKSNTQKICGKWYFYPRPPCGGRRARAVA